MNLSRLAVASQFSQSNKARSGRSEKAGKRRHGAPRRWRDLAQAVQQRQLGTRDCVGDGRGEAQDRRLAEEVVPRTSSRKSELTITTHPDGTKGHSVYVDGNLIASQPYDGKGVDTMDWRQRGGIPVCYECPELHPPGAPTGRVHGH